MVPQAYNSSERRQLKADQNFSVVGIFDTKYSTGSAVDKLREEGFKKEDITIVIPKAQTEPLELEKKGRSSKSKGSTARAVAKNGAVIGAALGGVVGAGVFFGPFFAAGAILASIVGAGLGGLFGDIMGTLFKFEIPKYQAKKNESPLKRGGILLLVRCKDSSWTNRAKKLLRITGAHDISSTFKV